MLAKNSVFEHRKASAFLLGRKRFLCEGDIQGKMQLCDSGVPSSGLWSVKFTLVGDELR